MSVEGFDLVAVAVDVIHPGCHSGSAEGCWVRHRAEARLHIVAELERLLIGLGLTGTAKDSQAARSSSGTPS